VIEKETPEKIAFKALKKDIGCTLLTDSFHFKASKDQLTNIKTKTRRKLMILASVNDALILFHDSSR